MISPHTPPGTKVVCIDAKPSVGRYASGYKVAHHGMDGLAEGPVYTVREIIPCRYAHAGLVVVLDEIVRPLIGGNDWTRGFALNRFRRAELPRVLTDILIAVPLALKEKANAQ